MTDRLNLRICLWPVCALVGILLLNILASEAQAQTTSTRPFSMGFTDYPYDVTSEASINWTQSALKNYGDLVTFHEEDAIPWTEALNHRYDLYHPNYQAEIYRRSQFRASLPSTHKVFLYLNLMNGGRNGIAGYRGANTNEPLPAPFDGLKQKFSDPRVIEAFVNHSEYLIATLKPTYFAYGIEANMMITQIYEGKVPAEAWFEFVNGAYMIYYRLKTTHPNLPIFFSILVDEYNKNPKAQFDALKYAMPASDLIAVSSYPFGHNLKASQVTPEYLTAVRALDPKKKFAIVETGWPAENVFYPDPLPAGSSPAYFIGSSPTDQNIFLNTVIKAVNNPSAEFVNWFVVRDYDDTYSKVMKNLSFAWLGRMWRDIGLFDGAGQIRTSLFSWILQKVKPIQQPSLPFGINTPGGWEDSPFLSLDGQRFYFMYNPYNFSPIFQVPNGHPIVQGRLRPGQTLLQNPWDNSSLFMSTKNSDGSWSEPVNLGLGNSACGMETADQSSLLFIRGTQTNGSDIFVSKKQADGSWGPGVALPAQVNSSGNEDNPHQSGNLLCYTSWRAGGAGGSDIWCSLFLTYPSAPGGGYWIGPISAGPNVNTGAGEDQVWLSPDQKRMYFTRYAEGSAGGIFMATRTATSGFYWTNPQKIDLGLQVVGEPALTADEKTMTFASFDSIKRDVILMQATKDAYGKWGQVRPID